MFRVKFLIAIILLLSKKCDVFGFFVKNGHSFERIFQNDTISSQNSLPTRIPDYISVTQILLDSLIQNSDSVKAQHLNKFNLGLHQFYLSLAYEIYYVRSISKDLKLDLNDPVQLPNATARGKPDICFHNVQVYGFPGFKNWIQRLESEQDDPYAQYYKILRTFNSDAMIFTGHFAVYNYDYFFTFYTRNNTLESIQTKWRSNEGTILPKRTKDVLHFDREDIAHAFQSSYKMFPIVNASLYKHLMSITEQIWLPKLVTLTNEKLYPESVKASAIFAGIYRRKVVETLIEAAKQYIKLINPSETFEASVLNFTSTSFTGQIFSRRYVNQKVEGILSFDSYTVEETKSEDQTNKSVTVVLETVSFRYPSSSKAFVKFASVDNEGKTAERKYQIAMMNVTCAYKLVIDQPPFSVSRKRDEFRNGSGFWISFDLLNYDFFFDMVIKHIGNDMARAISNLLDSEKDVFNVDFENIYTEV